MGFVKDLQKIVLKNSVIRYLHDATLDDDVYELIADKQTDLLLVENKQLKEEVMCLKMESVLNYQPTIDLEINGKDMTLTKDEFLTLVAKYKEKELKESQPRKMESGIFIPQDIVAITIYDYTISGFYCHYVDDFGEKRSQINMGVFDKYTLYFDLFRLRMKNFVHNGHYFELENVHQETITVSTSTTLTNEFLQNFSKGKDFIRK